MNTSKINSSGEISGYNDYIYECLYYTSITTTAITLLLGLVSWIKIPEFRRLKNYVFMNTIVAGFLWKVNERLHYMFHHSLWYFLYVSFQFTFACSFHSWLLIASVMFYVQFVQVFSSNVTRRYLKCALIGWTLPLLGAQVLTLLFYLYHKLDNKTLFDIWLYSIYVIVFYPLVVNVIIYVIVLHSLLKSRNVHTMSRVHMATLAFVMSGSVMSLSICAMIFWPKLVIVAQEVVYAEIILICFYFVMFKSNRKLWCKSLRSQTMRPILGTPANRPLASQNESLPAPVTDFV